MASPRPMEANRQAGATNPAAIRASWAISVQSVAWTLVTGCAAIAIGLAKGSVVLTAFGAVGLVDAVGSAALVHHYRHGLRHGELADHLEHTAHRIVVVGLMAVGAGAITIGTVRLASDHATEASTAGTVLAGASLLVLILLSRRKLRLAEVVSSPALRSDGHLSVVGATQAGIALVGVVTAMIGWHWADAAAATLVGAVAAAVGVQSWRAELRTQRPWTPRTWTLSAVVFVIAVAVVDALFGQRLVITGLLVFGPVLAAVSMRPSATALVGVLATTLAVILGAPNNLWLTVEHFMWIAAVFIVATTTALLVMVTSRRVAGPQSISPPIDLRGWYSEP
jgi:hypothetical protein